MKAFINYFVGTLKLHVKLLRTNKAVNFEHLGVCSRLQIVASTNLLGTEKFQYVHRGFFKLGWKMMFPLCLLCRCDGCGMGPIEGPRYHCQVCANFDYCQSCFDEEWSHNHPLERINDQGQPAVYVRLPR